MPNRRSWIDSHCHLADPRLFDQLAQVLERSRAAGIDTWVQGGICPEDWERQLRLQNRYGAGIVPAFGLHPWWVAQTDAASIEKALQTLEHRLPQAQALGELGLDYGPKHSAPEALNQQLQAFDDQLEIAKKAAKPLILHIVRAHAPALERLCRHAPFTASGIVHSFSGSYQVAKGYLDLGLALSIGGAVTRDGFQTLKKALLHLPFEQVCLETDSPDQMPKLGIAKPGELNEPANLVEIAAVVGAITGKPCEELLEQSSANARRIFGIKL